MSLFFMDQELLALMEDFYTLTGVKIVLFDGEYRELIAYPLDRKTFCMHMRENPEFNAKCCASDEQACRACHEVGELHIYRCHAGLTEAVAPITKNGSILGYMMFGQVTENGDKDSFAEEMQALCLRYGVDKDLSRSIKKIKYKNRKQIMAAARILDAFTEYILLKEMVSPPSEQLFEGVSRFVEEHLAEELTVDVLCRQFHMGRTRFYELMKQYTDGGIAAFIKQKRMEEAARLIRTTSMKISDISEAVGFSDYNYFLRVFKKEFGISSKKMREGGQKH